MVQSVWFVPISEFTSCTAAAASAEGYHSRSRDSRRLGSNHLRSHNLSADFYDAACRGFVGGYACLSRTPQAVALQVIPGPSVQQKNRPIPVCWDKCVRVCLGQSTSRFQLERWAVAAGNRDCWPEKTQSPVHSPQVPSSKWNKAGAPLA